MENKEDLLKIYSSYLPYELNVKKKFGRYSPTKDEILEIDDLKTFSMSKIFRPYLYSMDYLTKEIEHKGERFIPIEKFEIGDDDYGIEYDHGNIRLIKDLESISKYNSYHDIQFLPFEVVQRLIEWHFNVFGLSDSEFIKKETLNK